MHLQILTCPVHKQPHTHTAATLRGTSLPSFHLERMGHGIGSPDSRDAAHQATWKDRHRPSLEADPGIPLFSGSSRHLQSAGESWTVLPTLNTPLRLHGTHKPSRRRKYLRWWHRGQEPRAAGTPEKVGAQAAKAPVSVPRLADPLPFSSHPPSRIPPFLPVLTLLSQSSSPGTPCTFGCVQHAHL